MSQLTFISWNQHLAAAQRITDEAPKISTEQQSTNRCSLTRPLSYASAAVWRSGNSDEKLRTFLPLRALARSYVSNFAGDVQRAADRPIVGGARRRESIKDRKVAKG